MSPGTDNATAATLDGLGADMLRELFKHVPIKLALKLVCRAMRDAHPQETTTNLMALIGSAKMVAWYVSVSRHPSVCERSWIPMGRFGLVAAEFGQMVVLQTLQHCAGYQFSRKTCAGAAMGGRIETLKWLRAQDCPWDSMTFEVAARRGHLPIVEYAMRNGCHVNDKRACAAAAQSGNLEMLQTMRGWGFEWDKETCEAAAQHGHLEVLKWAREEGCRWDQTTGAYAARQGHIHVLEWLAQTSLGFEDAWGHSMVLSWAAGGGQLATVQWLSARGYRCNNGRACSAAAAGGRLDVLKWLVANGHEWDEDVTHAAAESGHNALLQWAIANGCKYDAETCAKAAERGDLAMLKWLRLEVGCPWDVRTMELTAEEGHLDVLAWALANGAEAPASVCAAAARLCQLDTLKWLRAHGVPWDASTCTAAVEAADMSVLHWARNEGCPWDEQTCACAAATGHLGVLQWLRSQGCPWSMETVTRACRNGHPEILTWAVHNGCPWIPWDARHAVGVFRTAATIAAVEQLRLETATCRTKYSSAMYMNYHF